MMEHNKALRGLFVMLDPKGQSKLVAPDVYSRT